MKKILFATSALVATGLFAGNAQAAEPIKLSVGGFMQYYYAFASEAGTIKKSKGNTDSYGVHTRQNNEVHFNGSTTLDNGITVAARIELEGTNDGSSNTDGAYVSLSGDFGQVTLGQAGTAGASMHVSPPSSGFIGADDGNFGSFLQSPSMNKGSAPDTYPGYAGGTDRKITYMSPSFSGVTFGASYTPDSGIKSNNAKSNHNDNNHNGVSLALAYGGEFSGMSLAASVGYERIDRAKKNVGVKTADKMTTRDSEAALFAAGIRLGFDAFTVGAAYGAREDAGDSNKELESFSVGVGYAMGDASVSFGYATGELKGMTDATTGKKSTEKNNTSTDIFDVGMDYKVSPGIKWQSSVTFVSFDGDKKYTKTDTNQNSGDSWVVGTGIALSF